MSERPPLQLTDEQAREAALLAVNLARNPAAIERVAAELALLRAIVRRIRSLPYVRNAPPVRKILDTLPRGFP